MFDVREEEPEPYLVMEYVKGQSLQDLDCHSRGYYRSFWNIAN
jgi:hypothetical protein